jgi:pSer/pThr/pTyr-binding forkhead associated (FHA) protein
MSTPPSQSDAVDPLAPHAASAGELKELLATERLGEPFLAFRDQLGNLRLYVLVHGTASHTLGRRPEMDLPVPWDNEISGLHAELQCLGGEWTIVDDNLSTNGTYVNGERVSGRRRLYDGDRIRLGRTLVAYNAAHASEVPKTVTAGDRPALKELSDTQQRILIALCRPYRDGGAFATPATNQQIADEVFLSVDAVKMHLRTLFGKFELNDLAQNQKRARLAECVFQLGLISQRDLD